MPVERWPPIYDAEDLKRVIDQIARGQLQELYGPVDRGGLCCQGDVLSFKAGVPVFEANGEAQQIEDFEYWLVIGNTCDFERSGVEWTQVVPITELLAAPTQQEQQDLASYRLSRRFFLPPWTEGKSSHGFVADFLRPVALHKGAVGNVAKVVSRMSRVGWILLHSCLVRFLARDDGRFDE